MGGVCEGDGGGGGGGGVGLCGWGGCLGVGMACRNGRCGVLGI